MIIQGAVDASTIIKAGTTSPVPPSTCADCIDRVFDVTGSGVTAEFNGLTIRHGFGSGDGGGIRNNGGTARIRFSMVTNNRDTAISNIGTLEITSSTLSGNSSSFGGGIRTGGDSSNTTITNSTLSGNTATFDGGGISITSGNLTISNSTLSGNTAGDDGGGIYIGVNNIPLR